jgi:hypothetical protein
MIQVTWDNCKEAFEQDGSLRDIYIYNTTLFDWQNFIDFIRNNECETKFFIGNQLLSMPSAASLIFEQEESPLLAVVFQGMTLNCHFFIAEEIEMDLDPREVTSREQFMALITFISSLGQVLGKEVRITPENLPDDPLFIFVPENNEVQYTRSSSSEGRLRD